MGLPYEAPSGGGYEDDSTAPDAGQFTDDLNTPGYDGYSHDAATAGDQDADEYDDEEGLEGDDFDEGGFGGQAGWDPGVSRPGGPGRM